MDFLFLPCSVVPDTMEEACWPSVILLGHVRLIKERLSVTGLITWKESGALECQPGDDFLLLRHMEKLSGHLLMIYMGLKDSTSKGPVEGAIFINTK